MTHAARKLTLSCTIIAVLAAAAWAQTAPATATAPGGRGAGRGAGRGGGAAGRDPQSPGFVKKKELPDGAVPPLNEEGNFLLGPNHPRAPEMTANPEVPQGQIFTISMPSTESKFYPGIARVGNNTNDPTDPNKLIVTTRPNTYTRNIIVYVPKQYVPGTAAPFIVTADGDRSLFTPLNNLIAAKKVPAMVAIAINHGGGDAQGSQRGMEYDNMNGLYAEWVQTEVLPLVEKTCNVKLTDDPDGRATTGGSSGGSCALIMAWFHPEWYHKVLTYSGTFVNQAWPHDPALPGGAWEFHKTLIPNNPPKPIRIWMEVGDRDLLNPNTLRDNMHDWVQANENMAKVLAEKGYHYQYLFSRSAGHVDSATKSQTLPEALEWLWQGYPLEAKPAK